MSKNAPLDENGEDIQWFTQPVPGRTSSSSERKDASYILRHTQGKGKEGRETTPYRRKKKENERKKPFLCSQSGTR